MSNTSHYMLKLDTLSQPVSIQLKCYPSILMVGVVKFKTEQVEFRVPLLN